MDYLAETARRIADVSSVADIELHAVEVSIFGQHWWDTRPMLDPREHCDEAIEMGEWVIGYATARGLVQRHPEMPHFVRVVRDSVQPEAHP